MQGPHSDYGNPKSSSVDVVFIASRGNFKSKQKHGGKTHIRCGHCNELEQLQLHCWKDNICNYFKKPSHIIIF